jgi:hypothetical protein
MDMNQIIKIRMTREQTIKTEDMPVLDMLIMSVEVDGKYIAREEITTSFLDARNGRMLNRFDEVIHRSMYLFITGDCKEDE